MYKMILIICFSLFLTGCATTDPVKKAWIIPEPPTLEQPQFQMEDDRLYLEKDDAVKLRNNILLLKAESAKLRVLVDEMLKHYTGE